MRLHPDFQERKCTRETTAFTNTKAERQGWTQGIEGAQGRRLLKVFGESEVGAEA